MSRLEYVHAFRRIPRNAGSEPVFGPGTALRRTTLTFPRRPDACRTLAAWSARRTSKMALRPVVKSPGASIPRSSVKAALSRRRSRVRVASPRLSKCLQMAPVRRLSPCDKTAIWKPLWKRLRSSVHRASLTSAAKRSSGLPCGPFAGRTQLGGVVNGLIQRQRLVERKRVPRAVLA